MADAPLAVDFRALVEDQSNADYLRADGWLALMIVGSTLQLALFDRRFNKQFPSAWRDGVAESFCVVMSVATSGRRPGRSNHFGWIGRMMQAF